MGTKQRNQMACRTRNRTLVAASCRFRQKRTGQAALGAEEETEVLEGPVATVAETEGWEAAVMEAAAASEVVGSAAAGLAAVNSADCVVA